MTPKEIQSFWDSHPCGDALVEQLAGDYEAFFDRYDTFRYGLEDHIPGVLDTIDLDGKEVLEIGLGQGADSEQLVRRGASWSGVDLTGESLDRVESRFRVRKLKYRGLSQATAVELPYSES